MSNNKETKKKAKPQVEEQETKPKKKVKPKEEEETTSTKKKARVEVEVEEEVTGPDKKVILIGASVLVGFIFVIVVVLCFLPKEDEETTTQGASGSSVGDYDYSQSDLVSSSSNNNITTDEYPSLEETTEFVPPTREEFIDKFFDGVEVEYPTFELNEAGELVAVDVEEYIPEYAKEGVVEEAAVYTEEELAELQKQIDEINAKNDALGYSSSGSSGAGLTITEGMSEEEKADTWAAYNDPNAPRPTYGANAYNAG